MTIVEEVAFRRMDARVASLLLVRGRVQNPIRMTHQEIAAELGSSRSADCWPTTEDASKRLLEEGSSWMMLTEQPPFSVVVVTILSRVGL